MKFKILILGILAIAIVILLFSLPQENIKIRNVDEALEILYENYSMKDYYLFSIADISNGWKFEFLKEEKNSSFECIERNVHFEVYRNGSITKKENVESITKIDLEVPTSIMFGDIANIKVNITSKYKIPDATLMVRILNPEGSPLFFHHGSTSVDSKNRVNAINFSWNSFHHSATFGNYTASAVIYAFGLKCKDLNIEKSFEVIAKPDLIVTSLLTDPDYGYEDSKILISAIITNQDYGNAKNFSARFYLDRGIIGAYLGRIRGHKGYNLIYNETINLDAWRQAFVNFIIENLSVGWYSLYLVLDEEDKINESNEDNNARDIRFFIKKANPCYFTHYSYRGAEICKIIDIEKNMTCINQALNDIKHCYNGVILEISSTCSKKYILRKNLYNQIEEKLLSIRCID